MRDLTTFAIFAALQGLTLGFIVYFLLQDIGRDSALVLSILFPLSTVAVELVIANNALKR
jgi:FtsH-binding integral membrane protein